MRVSENLIHKPEMIGQILWVSDHYYSDISTTNPARRVKPCAVIVVADLDSSGKPKMYNPQPYGRTRCDWLPLNKLMKYNGVRALTTKVALSGTEHQAPFIGIFTEESEAKDYYLQKSIVVANRLQSYGNYILQEAKSVRLEIFT